MADGVTENQKLGRIDEKTSNRQLAEIIASQSLDERVSSRKISITKVKRKPALSFHKFIFFKVIDGS